MKKSDHQWRGCRIITLLFVLLALGGCGAGDLPLELPREVPALPSLDEMPQVMRDLGLPNLDNLPISVPAVSELPTLDVGPGAVAFAGPTEQRIEIGERIPGTDMQLVGISNTGAEFQIGGLRSVRTLGDSLDYDGRWADQEGVDYNLRLRIYNIGADAVRAAGVQRLVVNQIQPQERDVTPTGTTLQVPFTVSVAPGQTAKGTTYGYVGATDRGAQLAGLPADEYPYRKVGDSVRWEGLLRSDLPIEYDLRVLFFNESTLQLGGVATIELGGGG